MLINHSASYISLTEMLYPGCFRWVKGQFEIRLRPLRKSFLLLLHTELVCLEAFQLEACCLPNCSEVRQWFMKYLLSVHPDSDLGDDRGRGSTSVRRKVSWYSPGRSRSLTIASGPKPRVLPMGWHCMPPSLYLWQTVSRSFWETSRTKPSSSLNSSSITAQKARNAKAYWIKGKTAFPVKKQCECCDLKGWAQTNWKLKWSGKLLRAVTEFNAKPAKSIIINH